MYKYCLIVSKEKKRGLGLMIVVDVNLLSGFCCPGLANYPHGLCQVSHAVYLQLARRVFHFAFLLLYFYCVFPYVQDTWLSGKYIRLCPDSPSLHSLQI